MYTLAFDTTASGCNIALLDENRVIDRFEMQAEFGQAEILVPQIAEMLAKRNLKFAQIGLLGVCVGPGSFTGVRSSVAAARALALASPQTAVTGVTAFEAYMHSLDISELSSLNAVIIETKRDDFYVQLFNGRLEKLSDAQALPYEDILPLLKGKAVTLIGDGAERFLDKPSGLVLHAIRMDKSASISDIAACALEKYKAHKLNYPKPMYLRAPDVCVKS
ncbi:MAG: tRNA (adenosine(37)-N6)-threonylcarbamoyltransferase complex dimerization subunit type 1 TsaB [Alphaproteobacteria bacterium]|nr:tRNA (adenosine(37)-N6)-threonylcarbamoyltransferase complex dimerization subunit type 1 TsaB [Alphaproteobacteria bacterium]